MFRRVALAISLVCGHATADEAKPTYDLLGDGKRIELKDKDFSIVPPQGWEIFTTHPSLTLLMQKPYQKGKYQRTIQVASFSGAKQMDDTTARKYEELIVSKFSQVTSAITDYKLRNHVPIELADGRQGILFYTEFKLYDTDLMQAHVLLSSAKRHYLVSFTDIAAHFEKEDTSQFLTEAWDSMTSIQLSGKPPERFEWLRDGGIAGGVLLVLSILIYGIRRVRAGRKYRHHGDGKDLDDVELTQPEKFVINSEADEPLSGMDSIEDEDDEQPASRAR